MKTGNFIDRLRHLPGKALMFTNVEGDAIHGGYHLTEIKAVNYDTVDCGGQTNRWNETVLQLWVPENAGDDYMPAGKFVGIYDKVRKLVPIDEEAGLRIEYGDENFFPTAYHVTEVRDEKDAVRVFLEPPSTTCKARDRARAGETESCCR